MKVEARAKTNLMLRILAREESGYHQIETLFQRLELADTLTVRVAESPEEAAGRAARSEGVGEEILVEGVPVTFEVRGVSAGALGPPAGNLVVRAIRGYLRRVRDRHGAEVVVPPLEVILEKRIPHGAGLGGGSSDAAAVLRALNGLASHGWGLPESTLLEVAAGLGSDVPFFLTSSPLALAWGRGGRLLALPGVPTRPVLLVVPPFPVATSSAYAALATHRADTPSERSGGRLTPGPASALLDLDDLGTWEGIESLAHNDFHAPIEALHPRLGALRRQLSTGGTRIALLSGSGSALVGIFADESTRDELRKLLEEQRDLRLIATRTVGPP